MVTSYTGGLYFIKAFAKSNSSQVEHLTQGSREVFFSEYNKLKNFRVEVSRIAKYQELEGS